MRNGRSFGITYLHALFIIDSYASVLHLVSEDFLHVTLPPFTYNMLVMLMASSNNKSPGV